MKKFNVGQKVNAIVYAGLSRYELNNLVIISIHNNDKDFYVKYENGAKGWVTRTDLYDAN